MKAEDFLDGTSAEDFLGEDTTKKTKKKKTTFGEDIAIGGVGVINALDTWKNMVKGGALSAIGREDDAAKVYASMEKRTKDRMKWANPDEAEQGLGGKIAGTVATLPGQILAFPFSPATTGKTALDVGETTDKAISASLLDTLGNVAALPLPGSKGLTAGKRVATGAAINTAQEVGTKAAISSMMDTEAGKKAFSPTWEDAAVAAIVGGGMGRLFKNDDMAKVETDKITKLREAQAAKAETKKAQPPLEGQAELFNVDTQGRGQNVNIPLDAPMRVDENGIPVREDLTQEIATSQRMMDETQPDLFDTPKSMGEVDRAAEVQKAMDIERAYMENPQTPEQVIKARQAVEEQQTTQQHLQELEQSLIPERVSKGQQRKMNRGMARRQGGAIDPDLLSGGLTKLFHGGREFSKWNLKLGGSGDDMAAQGPELYAVNAPVEKLNKGMARGQRGAFLFGESDKVAKVHDILQDTKSYISEDISVDKAIAASKGEADGGGTFGRYFGSGGVSEAMKRNSTMVLAGVRYVQNATKRADLFNRTMVKPFEDAVRKLDDSTITSFAELLKDEAIGKFTYDLADLQKVFTPEQLTAYQNFRKADKAAYEMQNAERTRMGKKPIPYNEWHVASRWEGDHRQPIKDADGKTVGFLAADTKWGLDAQIRTIKKNHPEYTINPQERILIKGSRRFAEGVDVDKAYSLALDLLGRDDPAVQKFAELYEQTLQETTRMTAGQEKHFKRKAGVGGFVGDRPDLTFDVPLLGEKTLKRNKATEARAYMQQQVNYLKNAAKWTEMQKAGESIKQLTSDAELAKEQPNNSAYLMDYWKTNLGFNESAGAKLVDDMFRSTGISPAAVNSAVGSTKTFFILQKLALSPGYIASNLLQTTAVLPYLMDLRAKGYKGNPLSAIASALPLGIMMAHGHWGRVLGKEMDLPLSRMLGSLSAEEGKFYSQALRFAEDNGTVSRSSYDESPIDSGRNAVTQAVDVAGKLTMAYPESIIRSIAYFSYVDMLKQSGKYKGDDMALFQHADELVSMSMVDYRQGERPMMFQKMGTFGNLANTLQTYPISFYNQWIYFAKEAKKGNMAPIMMATALQGSLAGLMGLPFVSDLDKLYQNLKSFLTPKQWAAIKGTPLEDPKLWLMSQPGGLELVNGLLSSKTGVAMTSRVAAPSFAEMAQAPVGPLQDIGRQIGDVASLAMDPLDPTKQAQAAMSVSPVATQGLVEQKMFPEQTGTQKPDGSRAVFNARELEKRDQVYTRTPADQDIRNWGVRSNQEVVSKEAKYRTDRLEQITKEKTSAVASKLYAALRTGDREKAHAMLELMVELSGKAYTPAQLKAQIKAEFMTAEMRKMAGAKTPAALARLKLMQEVLDRVREPETEAIEVR